MEDIPGTILKGRIKPKERLTRLLFPDDFDLIHRGHVDTIRSAKNSFDQVHLTIGIVHEASKTSVLSLEEKIETLRHIEGVDDLLVLESAITEDLLDDLNIDFVVAPYPNKYETERTIVIENNNSSQTKELIARAVRDYEKHTLQLVDIGFQEQLLNVSKAKYLTMKLKKKLKQLSKMMKEKGMRKALDLEYWLDKCRFQLQDIANSWSEKAELTLRKWIQFSGGKARQLYNAITSNL